MRKPLFIAVFWSTFLIPGYLSSQAYTLNMSVKPYDCSKGAAGVEVGGLSGTDVLNITWSNGRTNVFSISDLDVGDYNVNVKVTGKLDTTLSFSVEKTDCQVYISNQFTPNDDGYNDKWTIANWDYFPEFHLYVFNKWGQQVFKASGQYESWNGNLGGGGGLPVADGTYYYVFYYKGNSGKHLKGDVTILR